MKDSGKSAESIKTVVYSPVVLDLFHYGHLNLLNYGRQRGDLHITGVLSDEAVKSFRRDPISNLEERRAIAENLTCVDRVMVQHDKDPTENLKLLRAEYPEAKILLLYGSDWKEIPARKYLESIGGEVISHPYYERLSDFKIISHLIKSYKEDFRDFEEFTNYFHIEGIISPKKEVKNHIISTKANTLKALRPLLKKSKIEESFVFTVKDWNEKSDEIISQIVERFGSSPLVVRSSALEEDTLSKSNAGAFHSELDVVCEPQNIRLSVEAVVDSYERKDSQNLSNQILVQECTTDVVVSGVVFTRSMSTNAPYYVVNYDETSGQTDTVTKGVEGTSCKISHFAPPDAIPSKFHSLIEVVQEIESIIPQMSLDIEFAINEGGEVVIFQVRPIAVNRGLTTDRDEDIRRQIQRLKQQFFARSRAKPHLCGDLNYFGDMPDWNPAEILGDRPGHLDYSLYDYLITGSVWAEARHSQGYANALPAKLVILFANKPYVDVRNTFNSFLPAALSRPLRSKLVTFSMNKLRENPHLQDKVEFEILFTCYDFLFDQRAKELRDTGFSDEEIETLRAALIELTDSLVKGSQRNIPEDLDAAKTMEERRVELVSKIDKSNDPQELIQIAQRLLDDCKIYGTLQFSRLARLAFVGKILLKSLMKTSTITENQYNAFMASMSTVATDLGRDFTKLTRGEMEKDDFFKIYGHLRPRTYDITSRRYDSQPQLFDHVDARVDNLTKNEFEPSSEFLAAIGEKLEEAGLDFDARTLLDFTEKAIVAREFSKFEFTKNLSLAIECIALAGEQMGFTREQLSHLDLDSIFHFAGRTEKEIVKNWDETIRLREEERSLNDMVHLPDVIFSENDFHVIRDYSPKPNFITRKRVEGEVVNLDESGPDVVPDLTGKIVLLENGDPGYDWIFTKDILALITKYGVVASHMAIRCGEFAIPAAIGCGSLYDALEEQNKLILDCSRESISFVGEL